MKTCIHFNSLRHEILINEKTRLAHKLRFLFFSKFFYNNTLFITYHMVSDLLTEVCNENMIIYGRYLELKERLEERKKNVEFVQSDREEYMTEALETQTSDNEATQEQRTRVKKWRNGKKRNTKVKNTDKSQGEETDRSNKSNRSNKKSKKAKEKEILEKCRQQEPPAKFVIAVGDKTVEDTKKILWTQVVSKNKAPKIKEIVKLKGGDILITPADEGTRDTIKALANEGFGITQTNNHLPKIIIYDVDNIYHLKS